MKDKIIIFKLSFLSSSKVWGRNPTSPYFFFNSNDSKSKIFHSNHRELIDPKPIIHTSLSTETANISKEAQS